MESLERFEMGFSWFRVSRDARDFGWILEKTTKVNKKSNSMKIIIFIT
jgi:hypothetical protein